MTSVRVIHLMEELTLIITMVLILIPFEEMMPGDKVTYILKI